MENGTRVARLTERSLQDVIDKTRESSDLIQQIADASTQQAEAIAQINISVEQVSSVVCTNSKIAEHSEQAINDLIGLSDVLGYIIHKFKLKSDE